jgi:hypothetical protein
MGEPQNDQMQLMSGAAQAMDAARSCADTSLRAVAYVETADVPSGGIMDEDLEGLSRHELIAEVKRLRAGVREHRDSTGHDLCWHHPKLWALLPEKIAPEVAVPPWPKFLRGCLRYRESLERELPNAPVFDAEYE